MNTKDMEQSLSQRFMYEVSRNIAELSDRDSPEDYPDRMLVTSEELIGIMQDVHETVPAVDCAPLLSRIAELEARLEAAEKDAEQLLKDIYAIPKYSFVLSTEGGVTRYRDSAGNWLGYYEVVKLVDSAREQAAIRRGG